ncbi:MAG: hypothetical protein DMD95_09545 [Candidatus Rokuibacteriota bacterium]|nr:MAG: hypothetical protein DMD95_09545 [Candidatus Rokubacteria bacterium]
MLSLADLERALALALGEFGPAWKIVGDCAPVDPFDPSHWDSGSQSFQVTLRHRVTGHLKVLGRRVAYEPSAGLHRAVALSLIEAYRHGNAEPIRQYLEDIGVAATTAGDATHFFRPPSVVPSPDAASGKRAEVSEASREPDVVSRVSRSGVSTSRSPIVARPKWPSLSTVTSRWRRETPRPALPDAAVGGSGGPAATVECRKPMLSRLRRELEIWQWRRAASSENSRGPRTPEN